MAYTVLFFLFLLNYVIPAHLKKDKEDLEEGEYNCRFYEPQIERLVKSKYYLDKSLLIKAFVEDRTKQAVYVTAPRGFGKSANVLLLKHFLEIEVDGSGREVADKTTTRNYRLFTGLKIYKEHPDFFREHFGTYPVVYVDLGALNYADTHVQVVQKFRIMLAKLYRQHVYLLNNTRLWAGESRSADQFKQYVRRDLYPDLDEALLDLSFSFLCQAMQEHFDKEVVVLVNDYDAVVNSIVFRFSSDVANLQVFRNLHTALFAHNGSVWKTFATGVLHVMGDGLPPPGKGDMRHYPFLRGHRYCPFFGMTGEEVAALLRNSTASDADRRLRTLAVEHAYGGYPVVGGAGGGEPLRIYHTPSVLRFLNIENDSVSMKIDDWCKPDYFLTLVPLFHCKAVRNITKELIVDGTVPLETDTRLSWQDVSALCHIISRRTTIMQVLGGGDVRLFYTILLQLGLLTYVEGDKRNEDGDYLLRAANLKIKTALQAMLGKASQSLSKHKVDTIALIEKAEAGGNPHLDVDI